MKKIFFHPQTFNIVFHSFPLKQTSLQGPQVENVICNGFNVILLGIKESGIQKENKK